MSSTSSYPITLTISHRGQTYPLTLPSTSTLSFLQSKLHDLTSTPPHLQKLLYKGKNAKQWSDPDKTTLIEAGLKEGMKVQMVGTTSSELEGVRAVEGEREKREGVMRERVLKGQPKLRPTTNPPISTPYCFHTLRPLPYLPDPSSALSLLHRLSTDPAIQHVMHLHKFSVGVLTELAPHEHPELLGLNVNAGEQIKLRLRTNAYDGFRNYREIRRVLCHELTHNVCGDHDDNFKQLDSKLNRQILSHERSIQENTHTLGGYEGEVYEPYEPSVEAEVAARSQAQSQSLSTSTNTNLNRHLDLSADDNFAREERRRRMLDAAESRLSKEGEEEEMGGSKAIPKGK